MPKELSAERMWTMKFGKVQFLCVTMRAEMLGDTILSAKVMAGTMRKEKSRY